MISNWFISSISITIAVWIVAFINKIFAERKYDQKFSAMILYGLMFIISLLYLFIFSEIKLIDTKTIILAIILGVEVYCYSLVMMTVLRYLPTSIYFISIRV